MIASESDTSEWASELAGGHFDDKIRAACSSLNARTIRSHKLPLIVMGSRGEIIFDGRWLPGVDTPACVDSILALFQQNGNLEWKQERLAHVASNHKRHQCWAGQLRKLLKLSDGEWRLALNLCGGSGELTAPASHSAVLGLVSKLWEGGAFKKAFPKAAEICIVADIGDTCNPRTLFSACFNKKGSGTGGRVEIKLAARCLKARHHFCLRFAVRWIKAAAFGPRCECGCKQHASSLHNYPQPHVKPVFISPISMLLNMCAVTEEQVKTDLQWQLVQYMFPSGNGHVTYLDYFDAVVGGAGPGWYKCECESWRLAFAVANIRSAGEGGKAHAIYYDHLIDRVRRKLSGTTIESGSVYVALQRLKQSKRKRIWATYWTGDMEEADVISCAFADSTDVYEDYKGRSLIKLRLSRGVKRFQSMQWSNTTLINALNLLTTECSGSPPSIQVLFDELSDVEKAAVPSNPCKAMLLSHVLRNRLKWMWTKFGIEWLSLPVCSLVGLSYNAVLYAVQRSEPLTFGLEQLSTCYSQILSTFNRGGLSYASLSHISKGDKLGPFHNEAAAIATYDVSSSYPASLFLNDSSNLFVKGYHSVLSRCEGSLRSKDTNKITFFEYLNCYYQLAKLVADPKVEIVRVFHQYNVNGQYRIGHGGLDLLVICRLRDKRNRIGASLHYFGWNFHHQYTHGCPAGCKELPSYMGSKTAAETLAQSQKMDAQHASYFTSIFGRNGRFEVIYSCHKHERHYTCPFSGVQAKELLDLFRHSPNAWMQKAVVGFPLDRTINLASLGEWIRDPRYKCYVIGEGCVSSEFATDTNHFGYVMARKGKHLTASHRTHEPTLFDSDTLRFLMEERGFSFSRIFHVFVTPSCSSHKRLFSELCSLKNEMAVLGNRTFSKLTKIFLCSYIGCAQSFRASRDYVTLRSYRRCSLKSEASLYTCRSLNRDWVCVTRTAPNLKLRSNCQLVAIGALQFAKLHLLKTALFLERCLDQRDYVIAHCNTDAFTLVMSKNKLVDCVLPERRPFFEANYNLYFHDPPKPGFFKLESEVTSDAWKLCFHGSRTCRLKLSAADADDLRQRQATPTHLARYRRLCFSYGEERALWWTLPY